MSPKRRRSNCHPETITDTWVSIQAERPQFGWTEKTPPAHTNTQSPHPFFRTSARVADTIYMSWREGDRRQSGSGIGSEPETKRPHYSLPANHLCRPRPPTCTHINQLPFSIIIWGNLWPFDWTEMGCKPTLIYFSDNFFFLPYPPFAC